MKLTNINIITPKKLRFVLEVELTSNARKMIESLSKIQGITLYDDNNYGIYFNFRKLCYLLTKMYNENVEEYLSSSAALSIFKKHESYIINYMAKAFNIMCVKPNGEENATYKVLSDLIDDMMLYADSIYKEQYDKYYKKENIKWSYLRKKRNSNAY